MKIVLSCLAVLCFSASVGFAGPEALPDGKEMKQVAPAPPSCPNWAGFYAGIFGGYKFSVVNTDLDLGGLWENNPLVPAILDHQHDMDNSGAELGGVIGYNFQFGKWVLGGEFDGGYLWAREFKADTFPDDGTTYYNSQSFKTHYLLTVAPRIGYTFCNWMPYITGGLAVGDLEYSQRLVNLGLRDFQESFMERATDSATNLGWMVGGGLEYALTNHWHLRAQYQFIDLGDIDFHSAGMGVGGPASAFTGEHHAELREHNVSGALIFQF
ncbi:MAG TPA: outer membrane beta-barrel protein [Chthoniobacterales bacterium]|nr:outer membrane beta-barrel protein [Chthoniobacterales bacterium]